MGLLNRFRLTCGRVLVARFGNKQDPLAIELRDELNLDEKVDLRSHVSRYLSGDVTNSNYFEALPLVFWREIVCGDYPLHFLTWLERAYASYDLECPPTKHEMIMVRTLLAEARVLFEESGTTGKGAGFPRFEAARHLMLGIAVAVEQRVLKTGPTRMKQGLKHLTDAIRLFGTLKPGERALSDSDDFHLALALQTADWLLSELPDSEATRKKTLQAFQERGAVRAYAWVASKVHNWTHQYNLTEIYGELDDKAAVESLIRAIELNPRLADFELETTFDGVDEPLSKAPALRNVLPVIKRTHKSWLDERVAVYRRHAKLYEQDITKGVKAMLKDLKSAEAAKANALQRSLAAITLAIITLATSSFVLDAIATAKPIFDAL